jgi:DNA-directed RNA polymerase specialized sigma24 family protein
METSPSTGQNYVSAFPATHWTTIFETGSENPHQARLALEKLCELYRQPIVNWFARRANKQDAEDLAHSFMEYLLAKEVLSKLVERKGRFRSFLATVMQRFLFDVWAKSRFAGAVAPPCTHLTIVTSTVPRAAATCGLSL